MAFADVKDRVMKKVVGWKAKTLSQASRTTLIKAVATTLPQYYMSAFLMPKSWCMSIDQILKDFWWDFSTPKDQKFYPLACDLICLPKEFGGLGIRRTYDVNQAMIAKLG